MATVTIEPVAAICGDEVNGGLIRDLAFTVWAKCHNPTHEDGNTDWGNDTLPLVNIANERVRQALATARAEGRAEGMRDAAGIANNAIYSPVSDGATIIGEDDAGYYMAAKIHDAILAAIPQETKP